MDQEKFGKLIKEIRKKNNLTQKQFADKYNVTYQAVSKWENGKNLPDITLIKQIATDYNISVDNLIQVNHSKKKLLTLIIAALIIIIIVFIFCIIACNKDDFKFSTISSNCKDFNISGSISYNHKKAAIYISNIEYCNKKDTNNYKYIEGTLYESSNNSNKKISSFKYNKNKSMTFEINKNSFLPEVSENLEVCAPVEKPDCRPVGRKEISDTSRAREEIKKQIEYDVMVQRCQTSQLDELVEIMLEVRMNLSPTTRFSRDEVYPTFYVQDRYSRLNAEHIEQVLDGIRENTSKVMHTKAYLMKCLFNAPETLESKVMMDVNHDLFGERRRE